MEAVIALTYLPVPSKTKNIGIINANSLTKPKTKIRAGAYSGIVLKFLIGTHIAEPRTIKRRWVSKGPLARTQGYPPYLIK